MLHGVKADGAAGDHIANGDRDLFDLERLHQAQDQGSPFMKVEERVLPAAKFKPEVASLNMGSMNFGLFHLLDKYKEFKFDWEPEALEASRDLVFRNSFKDIEFVLTTCYDNYTRFDFECYDRPTSVVPNCRRGRSRQV
jgi:uncharacterized protein (DUF849 family)